MNGHFVAHIKRHANVWETFNDLQPNRTQKPAQTITPVQLIYVMVEDVDEDDSYGKNFVNSGEMGSIQQTPNRNELSVPATGDVVSMMSQKGDVSMMSTKSDVSMKSVGSITNENQPEKNPIGWVVPLRNKKRVLVQFNFSYKHLHFTPLFCRKIITKNYS